MGYIKIHMETIVNTVKQILSIYSEINNSTFNNFMTLISLSLSACNIITITVSLSACDTITITVSLSAYDGVRRICANWRIINMPAIRVLMVRWFVYVWQV
jgi:hypothetical protein